MMTGYPFPSFPTPDGKPKPLTGNGRDLPHMQSSLSPQGFGLYNSAGDDGGGDAPLTLASANPSPRNRQTFRYNEYLVASPSTSPKQQEHITIPPYGVDTVDDGRGGRNPMGNENLATHNNFGRGGGGGSYLNATSAPSFDSSKVICNLPPPSSSLGMGLEQSPLYKKLGERLADKAIMGAATPTTMRSGRIIPGSVESDRDRKKDRLIDSLSQSDMITCLPGFKKRPTQFPLARKSWPPNDQVVHRIAQQELSPNMMDYPGSPAPSVERSPAVLPPSSYARQAPAPLSPILNFNRDKFIHGDDGEVRRNVGGDDESGRYISPGRNPNSFVGGGNPIKDSNNARSIPPTSPITRAKAAIGSARGEVRKMNSIVEEERDRHKPHGSWKNMGTPFFTGSEPVLKSAKMQQKARYRMDLERQILASKMRKAEEERREREGTDHPLGPEYAHPALTYYNPPQKIIGNNSGSTATSSTVTAALTNYMKEKYSLGNPSAPESARSTGAASVSSSPRMLYPPEMGYINGGGTQGGRMGPPQQAKMEKVLGNSNLMKTRVQVGDQNQGSGNRSPPQQQSPLQQQALVPANMPGRPFNPQHQGPAQIAPQYGYPAAGVQQHPSRQYGYPVNMNPWQMYQHPTYAQYYGQLAGAAHNPGAVNPQQAVAAAQYYQQQQQNYGAPPIPLPPPSSSRALPPLPPHPLEEQQLDRGYSCSGGDPDGDDDGDFDFEALKEKAYKSQKIWQTSDELPDPGLRTAVYKAELRKQIDEDRRRKDERVARERLEDERIERKIKEFQEDERRRMAMEEQTRAELEDYQLQQNQTKAQQQNRRRKNEAFTISQNSGRARQGGMNVRRRRQRSMDHPTPRMGAGDFEEFPLDQEAYNNQYNDYMNEEQYQHSPDNNEFYLPPQMAEAPGGHGQQPVRKGSPPVPVVQRKLLQDKSEKYTDNHRNLQTTPHHNNHHPSSHIRSSPSQSFFHQLKERLKSEKDLVERRLQEKVVSTHKNLNLLKYSLNHD